MAQLEYQLRDPNCRKTLETLLSLRPEPTVYAMLGVLAFEAKDCTGAVRHYAAAGEAARDPIIRWQSAACHFQLQQWEPAETQFRELLALKEDERIRYNLGLAQVNAQKGRDRQQVILSGKFQRAIDRAKRKAKIYTAHEDIAQWSRATRPCGPDLSAESLAEATQLEERYTREHLGRLGFLGGWEPENKPADEVLDETDDVEDDEPDESAEDSSDWGTWSSKPEEQVNPFTEPTESTGD